MKATACATVSGGAADAFSAAATSTMCVAPKSESEKGAQLAGGSADTAASAARKAAAGRAPSHGDAGGAPAPPPPPPPPPGGAAAALPRSRFEAAAEADAVASLLARAATRAKMDAYADSLRAVTSKVVTVWRCAECARDFDAAPAMCAAEGHAVAARRETRHALACAGCDARILHAAPHAAHACARCGGHAWLAASVHRTKGDGLAGGPTLAGLAPTLRPTGDAVLESLRR